MEYRFISRCSTCQTANQWVNLSLDVCTTPFEYIKAETHNKILQAARDVAEYNAANTPNVSDLSDKNPEDLISLTEYNKLAKAILSSFTDLDSNTIIYGTYYDQLKQGLKDYQISTSTGYYESYSCHYDYGDYNVYGDYDDSGGCGWEDQFCESICMHGG